MQALPKSGMHPSGEKNVQFCMAKVQINPLKYGQAQDNPLSISWFNLVPKLVIWFSLPPNVNFLFYFLHIQVES